jgi:hypothetical protein
VLPLSEVKGDRQKNYDGNVAETKIIRDREKEVEQIRNPGGEHDPIPIRKTTVLLAPSPIRLSSFRLWAFASSLPDYSVPIMVVAEASRDSESDLYEVTFPSAPDFRALGLAISANFVVFIPQPELLKHRDAIPVLGNLWAAVGDQYHTVGALRHLGVLRAVPASIGQDVSVFDSLEMLFQQSFAVQDALSDALHRLFADAHFALGLFGFLETESGSERRAFEYAKAVAD